MEDKRFNVLAMIKLNVEGVKQTQPLIDKLIEGSRNEKGNVQYNCYQDPKESGSFIF